MYMESFNTARNHCGMNEWNVLVKSRMGQLKITQEQMAERMGVTQGAIGHWLGGKREPGLSVINALLAEVGMPPLSTQGAGEHANVAETRQPYRSAKEYPLISWVAAGAWAESCDNFHPGEAEEWLESNAGAGSHGYWLEVRGLSMVAPNEAVSFPPKMRILVNPDGFDLTSGKYYIAKLMDTGETTFKQYIRDAGIEYLQPLNPSFKTIEITSNVRIIGRVVDAKLPKALF